MEDNGGEEETDDGDDAAHVGYDGEGEVMRVAQRRGVNVHQHGEVREVIALTYRVGRVVAKDTAAFLRPRTETQDNSYSTYNTHRYVYVQLRGS